jgi:16S rRNA (guanine527-N7)-methyltransferase
VLAVQWPTARGILLDAHRQRCTFLEDAAGRLALADRVGVRCGRAEVLARTPELRGAADLVVARAFGAPAVTAECAVGFLAAGGRLVVSEPPEGTVGPDRWPPEALADLGLSPAVTLRAPGAGVAVMTALGPPDDRWPRGDGRPAKSPRW